MNVATAAATFQRATRLSVEQSCEVVLEEAQSIVPVDTGELRESGHIEIQAAPSLGLVSGHVIFDAEHAAYIEFGTGIRGEASPDRGAGPYDPNWPGMEPQPYLRPAADSSRPAIQEIFASNLTAAAKLVGKS